MESEKLSELVLEGLHISENGCLVSIDSMHVSTEGLHILSNEDSVLLGLVPESIETVSECEHQVLEIGARTRWGRRQGRLWRWWVSGGLPRDRPGGQNEPDTHEAHPSSRAHCPSRTFPHVVVHSVCHA